MPRAHRPCSNLHGWKKEKDKKEGKGKGWERRRREARRGRGEERRDREEGEKRSGEEVFGCQPHIHGASTEGN